MDIFRQISRLDLFDGVPEKQRRWLVSMTTPAVHEWNAGSVMLAQDAPYEALSVLLSGTCHAEMLDANGKTLRVESFTPPYAFAPAVLFATHNRMPGSVIAETACSTATLTREDILRLCSQSDRFLENLLRSVSDRFVFISRRLSFLSFHTIREKVVSYLLGLPGADAGTVKIDTSYEKLAEYFGVARPSLSRVFAALEDDGLIVRSGRTIDVSSLGEGDA